MDTHEHQLATNGLKIAVEHYQQIAGTALADAHAWLRQGALSAAILEAMPDAILVVDIHGTIISANSQFELMFGYPRSEVIGRELEMLLPDDARVRHVHQRRAYFDHPSVRDMRPSTILRGRRKNGTEIELLIRLGPVVIPSGVYTIVCIRRTKE